MNKEEFYAEYYKVSARVYQLAEKVRREGLLAIEDDIDSDKLNQRDILEYGLRFIVDGTDVEIVKSILPNIINQEEDKYARQLMEIKKEAVLSIQAGDNPWISICRLNSFTDIDLIDDPVIKQLHDEDDDEREITEDEIDALIGGDN